MKYNKVLICGLRCCGKSTLFWNLQKKLQWPTLSTSQLLRDHIRNKGLTHRLKKIQTLNKELSAEVDGRTINLLNGDNSCIIETRAFSLIDRQYPGTLKVLLTCQNPTRFKRYAYRENTSLQKAQHRILKKDQEWFDNMKSVYGRDDFFNPKYYDLVIDTTMMDRNQVTNIVLKNLR